MYLSTYLWVSLLSFSRILGMLSANTIFSASYFSKMLRSCVAILLSILVIPLNLKYPVEGVIFYKIFYILLNFGYGYLIGFFLSFPIWLVESCGRIIDTQRGEQMGAIVSQLTKNPSSSMGKLLVQAFTVYLVMNNGILYIFGIILNSFAVVPINKVFQAIQLESIDKFIGIYAEYFYWMVILVIPIVFVLLLIDISFGVIGSFVPQLNITIISMPIKSILTLLLLSIYIGVLFHNVFSKFILKLPQIY